MSGEGRLRGWECETGMRRACGARIENSGDLLDIVERKLVEGVEVHRDLRCARRMRHGLGVASDRRVARESGQEGQRHC